MGVELQLKAYAERLETRLSTLLPDASKTPVELVEAMRYASLGPGKKLRPALVMASAEAAGGSVDDALDMACAVELVHCFSLVHDDLPAVDNDALRRGRPTLHVQFGEAIAILAGDALFALAFEAVACAPVSADRRLDCLKLLTRASGIGGLVAGETADILAEGKQIDADELDSIHNRKTGALIRASCQMGAVCVTDDSSLIHALGGYGSAVGLAFQIADDVLNETATAEQLGKAAGSDRERNKATYPALLGLEASKVRARQLAEEAVRALDGLPGPTEFLRGLAFFSVERGR